MENGPIFIGGPDRCGKTTMRAFLVSHPRIAIPAVGSNMWTYFYGQYGDLSRPENFERCLRAMLKYKHVVFLQPDPERIRREFQQGPASYGRLFGLFQAHFAERECKPRWGDQTGYIERYAAQVFEAYPDAKMIHMVRDPRDRYEASLALWPTGQGRAGGATARWLYSVQYAKRNLKRYPDRYRIVRYETLISEPERTLREVCDFLGEAYTPAMLAMDGAAEHRDKMSRGLSQGQSSSPLSTEFIGKYRQMLAKDELAFMQSFAGREMTTYQYQLDSIKFTPSERLSYWLTTWPANLVRMLTWRTVEGVHHNFPGVIGRKPAAKMVLP